MCGILRAGSFGSMALTSPLIQPNSGDAELEAALGHQLRADADAEKRPQPLAHCLLQRLAHVGNRIDVGSFVSIGGYRRPARLPSPSGCPADGCVGGTPVPWQKVV
jgi:hypothetical protein